jgi:recombination protein RecR
MAYPRSLNNLINNLKYLPGVGERTAERMALAMIEFEEDKLDSLAASIQDVKNKIRRCSICNNLTENNICDICSNKGREQDVLCVVEDVKSIILFEKNSLFNGQYHVLNGLISPVDGIDPNDINIDTLLKRIVDNNIKEVIIAIKPSLEGETTALYIAKKLGNRDVIVSKIAHGIPMGADMEYMDAITLETALFERRKIS